MSKSLTLDDLAALADRVESGLAEIKQVRDSMSTDILQLGQSMAEILDLLQRQGPDTAKAIAQALANLKIQAATPSINLSPNFTLPALRMDPIEVRLPTPTQDARKLALTVTVEKDPVTGANKAYRIRQD